MDMANGEPHGSDIDVCMELKANHSEVSREPSILNDDVSFFSLRS